MTPGENVTVKGSLTNNTIWAAKNKYLLGGFVYVESGATLTIEPGTIIKGDKASKATLIIKPGGKIIAEGTKTKPIVFTSNQARGSRNYGDWGGVIVLGKAPVNKTPATIEGENISTFGGTDPTDNSGILKYVRIEFGGIAFETDKEVNGLTLGGVGSGTTIENVQVSNTGDDGFEWFGGTVNVKNLISFKNLDDDFDTDWGYSGRVQYGLAFRDPKIADQCTCSDSNGFESDNDASGSEATPQTSAKFANISIIMADGTPDAKFRSVFRLRRNTAISIYNTLGVGAFPKGGIELQDASTQANFVSDKADFRGLVLGGMTKAIVAGDEKISNAQIREIKADFKSDTKEICAPATVNIINLSKDAVSFDYFFPGADSAFETTENPVIHFSKGGVSSGRLIATDLLGCRDTIVIDSFNVHQVISSLVPERKLMCQDSVLHFLDKSIAINDSIIHNQWSFGNFLIKDTSRVGVKLDVVSTPLISISVESIHGCVHEYSLITPNKIIANAVVDTLTCNRQMLQFNPAIQGQWTNVKWLFGDSTGSDQPSPLHRYTMDGLYFVSLAVEDTISGCDVKVDSIVKIRVEDPTADFKFLGTATTNCRPYIATFSNLSNNAIRFQWEFGDQSTG